MADGAQVESGGSAAGGTAEGLQPHSIEAEQALLGALLLNNDIYDRISAIVQAAHFFDPVHRRIFEAASGRIARNALASPVTLKPFLADDPGIAELGGADYLAKLTTTATSLVAARDYAEVIRDCALRRDLVRIGEEIQVRATSYDIEMEPADQIPAAEAQLYSLAEQGTVSGGFSDFATAATDAANMVNAAFKRGGGLAGISTGLRELDHRLGGLRPSDLLILAARPSMGKTALALNVAFNIARKRRAERNADGSVVSVEGGVVGFFSLEMSSEQLATRLLAAESGVQGKELLSGHLSEDDYHRFLEVAKELQNLPLYIDDTPALPLPSLAARARRLKRQHGLDVLVVDYLQLIRPASSRGEQNRVNEVSEISQGLKAIAKELDVPVIALSQLSRQVESREDKRPQLSDLRESGSIEQDADVVMFIFRESYYHDRMKPPEDDDKFPEWKQKAERLYGRAEVIIGKQRHGPIGTAELAYEDSFTRFSDPAERRYGQGPEDGFR